MVIGDLPVWDWTLELVAGSTQWRNGTLEAVVTACHSDTRTRELALGATLEGAGEYQPNARIVNRISVPPGRLERLEIHCSPLNVPSGYFSFRVFFASEGGFGFVGQPIFLPGECE